MPINLSLRNSYDETVVVDDAVARFLASYLSKGWGLYRGYGGLRRPIIYQPQRNKEQPPVIPLARWIMRAAPDQFPQHHDGDVLNCLRSNLYLDGSRGRAFWERRYAEESLR
jgi:hypothetical protein